MLCIWCAVPNQPDSLIAACRSILFNPSLYKQNDLLYTFASGFYAKIANILHLICLFCFSSQKHYLFQQRYALLSWTLPILEQSGKISAVKVSLQGAAVR